MDSMGSNNNFSPITSQGTPAVPPASSAVAPAAQPRGSKKIWWWLLAIVILAAVVVAGWWYWKAGQNPGTQQIAPGVVMVTAKPGTVISNFPAGLIVEQGVTPTQSYSINYTDGSSQQPVVAYTSANDVRTNITAFRTYFTVNGWTIVEPGVTTEQPASIMAVNGKAQASITLYARTDGKTDVTIAYLVNS